MNAQMLFGDLGGRELILTVAIALLLAKVSRLTVLQRARSPEESRNGAEKASSRAYLDRLLGPGVARAEVKQEP